MSLSVKKEKIDSYKRVTRPGHYIFKIHSFTWLSEVLKVPPSCESLESPTFETGGHKWKLSVYPNGNKKTGGDHGHLSLYLVSADDDIDRMGTEIHAMFKFFIMDQLHDNYLTFQDSQVRRFHSMKKEWGFTKLIDLKTFKDAKNGYLIDDCCVFGVEISVIPSEAKSGRLSFVYTPLNETFTWEVANFSALNGSIHRSKKFTVEGCEWYLSIYPNGYQKADEKYISFYLMSHTYSVSCRSKVFAEFVLSIKDQVNGKHKEAKYKYCFNNNNGYGSPRFVKRLDLEDKSLGFLIKDKVIFEVKFRVISKLQSI